MDAEKPKKIYHVIATEAQIIITKLLRDKEAFHLCLIERHDKNTLDVVHNNTYYRIVSNSGDNKAFASFASLQRFLKKIVPVASDINTLDIRLSYTD